jgi:hypothetical protein
MGKAHKLTDWMPIDANTAVKITKKPERVLRDHTREELEVIRKLITDNVNRRCRTSIGASISQC